MPDRTVPDLTVLLSRRHMLLALACLPGCALLKGKLEAPKVTLQSVTPETFGRDGQAFRARLLVENPNDQVLNIVGGEVAMDIAGFSAGRAQTIDRVSLPALGSREVDVRLTVDLLSTLSGALKWLAAGNPDLEYTLRGFVDLDVRGIGRLPIRSTGKVTAEKLLRQLPGLLRSTPAPSGTAL